MSTSIMRALHSLHWLPTEFQIQFMVLVLIIKVVQGLGQEYLKDLLKLQDEDYGQQLHSSGPTDHSTIRVTLVCVGNRTFSNTNIPQQAYLYKYKPNKTLPKQSTPLHMLLFPGENERTNTWQMLATLLNALLEDAQILHWYMSSSQLSLLLILSIERPKIKWA